MSEAPAAGVTVEMLEVRPATPEEAGVYAELGELHLLRVRAEDHSGADLVELDPGRCAVLHSEGLVVSPIVCVRQADYFRRTEEGLLPLEALLLAKLPRGEVGELWLALKRYFIRECVFHWVCEGGELRLPLSGLYEGVGVIVESAELATWELSEEERGDLTDPAELALPEPHLAVNLFVTALLPEDPDRSFDLREAWVADTAGARYGLRRAVARRKPTEPQAGLWRYEANLQLHFPAAQTVPEIGEVFMRFTRWQPLEEGAAQFRTLER